MDVAGGHLVSRGQPFPQKSMMERDIPKSETKLIPLMMTALSCIFVAWMIVN